MTADCPTNLTDIEQLLLMAAAVQGIGPACDLDDGRTAIVVNQVLAWRGLSAEQISAGWWDNDPPREHEAVYDALVRMTWQQCRDGSLRPPERPGPALFEGGGNWGVPGEPTRRACSPLFNVCRLTAEGERIARELLAMHPEYRT